MYNKRVQVLFGILILLVLLIGPAVPALADGIIIPDPPPDVPIVEVPYLTIKYHRVTVTIEDQVATTHVDQVFVNEGRHEVEGTYIFPLPEEATISEFAMWVDGERLEGQVLERDEARRIYEDIVRRRRDPALLEYVGRNTFQASIYPIPPGGERRIELEYSEVLLWTMAWYSTSIRSTRKTSRHGRWKRRWSTSPSAATSREGHLLPQPRCGHRPAGRSQCHRRL